jgi:hypothetical protein
MRSAVLALVFALPTTAIAQQVAAVDARAGGAVPARIPVTAATTTRAPQAPKIDGKDDDAVWQSATRYSEFRMFQPNVDVDPTFKTEFRTAFDEKNLYVFVRMFDPNPDSIMRALTRRDQRGPSDQIKVMIDSYNDKRSGYEFAVNPVGVKRDFSMSNDGNEDSSWDGIWDVATTIDAQGWTAEFQIPLSQMRYGKAESHTFGFGIWRDIERKAERTAWPLYNPRKSGLSSQLGTLSGLNGLSTDRRMEATPYVVTKDRQKPLGSSKFGRDQDITVGADMKIGITPNVTLDATVNPDFGQVEADPAVVNLSAFETFFSERRPFFIEGAGNYRFQLNCYIVVDCSTNEGLFYSRRIGRSPTLRGVYGDANTAISTPIAAATKLTGRTAGGMTFGLLDAWTPRVTGVNNQTVEPATNYAVLRAQQDLKGGEAGFSLIGTAVNRSLDNLSEPFLHKSAYAGGGTYRNRFNNREYEFQAQLAASHVTGTPAVIRRTQTNAVHYYQQPGDELTLDTTRTSLSGYEGQVKFGKYGGGITRFETSVVHQSAGFDVNDLGFLRRGDYTDWSTWAALSWREAKGIYRWAQLNGNHWIRYNTSGTKLDHSVNFNGHMGLNDKLFGGALDNWDVHLGGTLANVTASSCDRCSRGGPVVRNSRGFYPWGGFNSDGRKRVQFGQWFNFGMGDEGESKSFSTSPYVTLRPSTQLVVSVGWNYSKNTNHSQWFGNFVDGATTHYSFAHLEQTTVSMSVRTNFTATKNLTFEFYAEPFTSNGEYSDFRELSSTPTADKYDGRYVSYTPPASASRAFQVSQLRTNAVMRWEYRPGSTLFAVWQHGRSGNLPQASTQGWSRDYGDLFSMQPDNTFLIKLAYWINK